MACLLYNIGRAASFPNELADVFDDPRAHSGGEVS
jgi:hypothetical protein